MAKTTLGSFLFMEQNIEASANMFEEALSIFDEKLDEPQVVYMDIVLFLIIELGVNHQSKKAK